MAPAPGEPLVLSLRQVAKPDDPAMLTPLQREQLKFFLDHPEGFELTELFSVHDASGEHLYDMHLFCGDDGQVFVRGTTTWVASFSQGGASCDDSALEEALNAALKRVA